MKLDKSEYTKDAFKCHLDCPINTPWTKCPFKLLWKSETLCKYPKFKTFMEDTPNENT